MLILSVLPSLCFCEELSEKRLNSRGDYMLACIRDIVAEAVEFYPNDAKKQYLYAIKCSELSSNLMKVESEDRAKIKKGIDSGALKSN